MRISFDVDDTLICYQDGSLYEPNAVPAFLRVWFSEPLRQGARELMRSLITEGHEVWIYTTSLRSPAHLKMWLWFYGIRLTRAVNDAEHDKIVDKIGFSKRPSKYPRHFNIDLHVDDSEGVLWEGQEHGFAVVVVNPTDPNWANRVKAAVRQLTAR